MIMSDQGQIDEGENELAETLQRLETAVKALREIATPQRPWPVHFGGPGQAMEARARQALEELGFV